MRPTSGHVPFGHNFLLHERPACVAAVLPTGNAGTGIEAAPHQLPIPTARSRKFCAAPIPPTGTTPVIEFPASRFLNRCGRLLQRAGGNPDRPTLPRQLLSSYVRGAGYRQRALPQACPVHGVAVILPGVGTLACLPEDAPGGRAVPVPAALPRWCRSGCGTPPVP